MEPVSQKTYGYCFLDIFSPPTLLDRDIVNIFPSMLIVFKVHVYLWPGTVLLFHPLLGYCFESLCSLVSIHKIFENKGLIAYSSFQFDCSWPWYSYCWDVWSVYNLSVRLYTLLPQQHPKDQIMSINFDMLQQDYCITASLQVMHSQGTAIFSTIL